MSAAFASEMPAKEEALREKESGLWQCVDKEADKFGGFLFRFHLKPEYNPRLNEDAEKRVAIKAKKLFPAIEPRLFDLIALDPSIDDEEYQQRLFQMQMKGIRVEFEYEIDKFFTRALASQNPEDFEAAKREFLAELSIIPESLREQLLEIQVNSYEQFKKNTVDMLVHEASEWRSVDELERRDYRFFNELGYKAFKDRDGNYIFQVPDRESLLARWNILRESHSDLPELNIFSSTGIADDISFIESFFIADVLLSEGREFLHDHISHIIPTIELILDADVGTKSKAEKYKQKRNELIKRIARGYKQIMLFERGIGGAEKKKIPNETISKFKTSLGALVDQVTNLSEYNDLAYFHENMIISLPGKIWSTEFENWHEHWERRFEGKELILSDLEAAWEIVRKFVPEI